MEKQLLEQWDFEKNKDVNPQSLTRGSHYKAWWKCDKGLDHQWQAVIKDRWSKNSTCPYCSGHKVAESNCLKNTHSELCEEWHVKNKLKPTELSAGSNIKIWWKCPNGPDHEWEASPNKRTSNPPRGCPFCAGKKVSETNSLLNWSQLCKEWSDKNVCDPKEVLAGTAIKYWWQCQKNIEHLWEASVVSRTAMESGCPFCCGKKVLKSESLGSKRPDLVPEWHPNLNKITPYEVTLNCNQKFWWQCQLGHEWKATVSNRTGPILACCPVCRESKGEKLIAKYLIENNVKYTRQFKFKDCKNKRPLPFDFAIHIKGQLALIEYQGEHHFEHNYFSKRKKSSRLRSEDNTLLHDEIKKEYCFQNNIPLLEINYKDKNPIIAISAYLTRLWGTLQTEAVQHVPS